MKKQRAKLKYGYQKSYARQVVYLLRQAIKRRQWSRNRKEREHE